MSGKTNFLAGMALCTMLSACATSSVPATAGRTSQAPDVERMEAIFWARQDSARMRFVQADVTFMTGMIGHHAQALIMARLAPENDAGPEVSRLAARIINAQNDEIASMQTWLRDRDQPVPEVHIDGLNLMVHGSGPHKMMPGMLTDQQLQELSEARGTAFDRLFLTYMIQHHKGAITMVEALFSVDGAGQDEASFKLASDINVDQITEIARMELMLERMSSAGATR